MHAWSYNKLDRLVNATFPGDASPTLIFTYLGNDDLDTLTHGNGLVTDYDYHPEGALQSITVGASLHALEYGVDGVQNVRTITETLDGGSAQTPDYVYGYDAAYRLVSTSSFLKSGSGSASLSSMVES